MECHRSDHQSWNEIEEIGSKSLNRIAKMTLEPRTKHQFLGIIARSANGKCQKVTMKARVDGESSSGGIHTGNILDVFNFFRYQLNSIIPFETN
jgi:hypothetical protein